jgi:pantoate--beta-alanine ligase
MLTAAPASDPSTIETVRSVAALRARVAAWRSEWAGEAPLRVALAPTMGALHLGHLSLIHGARAHADRVIVSLFVNPTQFGPGEDFANYPRDEAADLRALALAKADLLYAPSVEEMYGPGFATTVSVAGVSAEMEGAVRPHHFAGVATVVAKLLIQTQADLAYFGEKDYQQLIVVRRMAADLDIPTRIVGMPTVRDVDGLALSSRNAYLTPEERQIAPALHRALNDVMMALTAGRGPAAQLIEQGRQAVLKAGFSAIDYFDLRDAETLEPISEVVRPARVLAAARLGKTRLIDNLPVAPPPRDR